MPPQRDLIDPKVNTDYELSYVSMLQKEHCQGLV